MMQHHKRTSTCLVAAAALWVAMAVGVASSSGYDELNRYLQANVKNGDPRACVEKAAEHLHNLRNNLFARNFRPGFLRALEEFSSLGELDDQCNLRNHQILATNFRNIDHASLGPLDSLPKNLRLIDWVVRDLAERHAHQCRHELPRMASNLLGFMDQNMRRRAESFGELMAEAIVQVRSRGMTSLPSEQQKVQFVLQTRDLTEAPPMVKAAIEALTKLSHSDPNRRFIERTPRGTFVAQVRHLDKIGLLFERVLVRACVHYVDSLQQVFTQAELAFKLADQWFDPHLAPFYQVWAHFRVCRLLAEDKAGGLASRVINEV